MELFGNWFQSIKSERMVRLVFLRFRVWVRLNAHSCASYSDRGSGFRLTVCVFLLVR